MHCLTVKQPWATLLVAGATQYIVRDWRTSHRGLLAIHAGALMPRSHIELCCDPEMRDLLRPCDYEYAMELPTRAILGTVTVADCLLITEQNRYLFDPEDPAVRFGLIQPDRWAWLCTSSQRFPRAISLPGRLGIFTIPTALLKAQSY